jgi:hypothetical protein
MRNTIRAFALAAVVAPAVLFAAPSSMSAQSLAGTWEASVPMRMSNEGGEMVPSGFVPVKITIEQRGDSVFATWAPAPTEEMPSPKTRALKGVMKDGAAVVSGEPVEGRMNQNGEESVMKIQVVYTFKLVDGALQGRMSATGPDGQTLNDRVFKAVRKA